MAFEFETSLSLRRYGTRPFLVADPQHYPIFLPSFFWFLVHDVCFSWTRMDALILSCGSVALRGHIPFFHLFLHLSRRDCISGLPLALVIFGNLAGLMSSESHAVFVWTTPESKEGRLRKEELSH